MFCCIIFGFARIEKIELLDETELLRQLLDHYCFSWAVNDVSKLGKTFFSAPAGFLSCLEYIVTSVVGRNQYRHPKLLFALAVQVYSDEVVVTGSLLVVLLTSQHCCESVNNTYCTGLHL